MLTRFRLLDAALRMDNFTVAELARESQVSHQWTRKFIRDHPEVFRAIASDNQLQRRNRAILHSADKLVVQKLLEEEVSIIDTSADMPNKSMNNLGLSLAQSNMLERLPLCDSKDRWDLVKTAEIQLMMIDDESSLENFTDLQSLQRNLKIVVCVQEELVHASPVAAASPSYTAILSAVDTLISATERRARDHDKFYQRFHLHILLELPKICVAFAVGTKTERLSAQLWDRWWIDFPRAALDLMSHKLWQFVVGDLTMPNLLREQALSARWISSSNSEYDLSRKRAIADRLSENLLNRYDDRNRRYHSLSSVEQYFARPRNRMRPSTWSQTLKGFKFVSRKNMFLFSALDPVQYLRLKYAGTKRVELIEAPLTAFFDQKISTDQTVGRAGLHERSVVGLIEAADLDLVNQTIEGFHLNFNTEEQDNNFVEFKDIHVHDDVILLKAKQNFLPDPQDAIADVDGRSRANKSGVLRFKQPKILQIRLDPGHAIDVVQVVYDFDINHTSQFRDQKVGQVWWIDIDGEAGKFKQAHILYEENNTFSPMPFSALNYDVERQCFFFEVGSGENPNKNLIVKHASRSDDLGTQH